MKKILTSFLILFLVFGALGLVMETSAYEEDELDMEALVSCLEEEGVVIYGAAWCPACRRVVEDFGGDEIIEPIYVECSEEREKCRENQKTSYVPEIQIKGTVYTNGRAPMNLARETGCESVAKTGSNPEELSATEQCRKDIREAEEYAGRQEICTHEIAEMECPHQPGFTHQARNGCIINALENSDWSRTTELSIEEPEDDPEEEAQPEELEEELLEEETDEISEEEPEEEIDERPETILNRIRRFLDFFRMLQNR